MNTPLKFCWETYFIGLRFFNEPEISDSGPPALSPSRRTCAQDFYVLKIQPGLNQWILNLEESTLPLDHRGWPYQVKICALFLVSKFHAILETFVSFFKNILSKCPYRGRSVLCSWLILFHITALTIIRSYNQLPVSCRSLVDLFGSIESSKSQSYFILFNNVWRRLVVLGVSMRPRVRSPALPQILKVD